MSERETNLKSDLQQWKGVDQRTQPTLVQDGFFVMARGVFFGLGENAERLPGKKLAGVLGGPIFHLWQFGENVFVQSMETLWMLTVAELIALEITFQPAVPPAPTLGNIDTTSLDVTLPATYPLYATSFSLQRSLDDATWTTVATGLTTLQVHNETGLTPSTLYYYRLVAVNAAASTNGPSANATTNPPSIGEQRITELSDNRITEAGDNRVTE